MKRQKVAFEIHYGKKFKATEGFPVMRRFLDVISDDMKKRRIFWEE